jgi:RNA polymerase sigma-70 factor, ECF subfamily
METERPSAPRELTGDAVSELVVAVDDAVLGQIDVDPGHAADRLGFDPADFPVFYGRYRQTLSRRAAKFLSDRRDIDEVVQETFIKVFLTLPELDSELAAVRFAHRVLTNMCIDRYRTAQRRPRLIELDGVEDRFSVADADPLLLAEDAAIVRDALARLSPEHRAALVKREIEEKSLPAIAAEMGVPEESVKHLLFRARRALRRLLVGTSVDPSVDLTVGDVAGVAGRRLAESGVARGLGALIVLGGAVAWVLGAGSGGHQAPVVAIGAPHPVLTLPLPTSPSHHVTRSGAQRHHAVTGSTNTATTSSPASQPTVSTAPKKHPSGGHPSGPTHHGGTYGPGPLGPFTVSGLGASDVGQVDNESRIVEAPDSYQSTASFSAATAYGQFALGQSLAFTAPATGQPSAVSATLNPVVPQQGSDGISAGYIAAAPTVSLVPSAGGYTVTISGVAQSLTSDAAAPEITISVTAMYDPTLTTVTAEQVAISGASTAGGGQTSLVPPSTGGTTGGTGGGTDPTPPAAPEPPAPAPQVAIAGARIPTSQDMS